MPLPGLFNSPFDFNKPMTVLDVEKMCDLMEADIDRIRKKNREAAEANRRPTTFFDFAGLHEKAASMCEWTRAFNDKGEKIERK